MSEKNFVLHIAKFCVDINSRKIITRAVYFNNIIHIININNSMLVIKEICNLVDV